jgi:enoyl-CoA hydratase/carnithine racemase
MAELVRTEDRGAVRHLFLNRPEKRNAFNGALIGELTDALRETAADPSVHVIVLRGEGPMFSSGVDLSELKDFTGRLEMLRPFRTAWLYVTQLLEETPKATICAIHGACIGGALETALACDLRVSTPDALMGLPETRIGLIPDVGGSTRLPAVVGLGRAKELIMTGKLIGGEEAERIGLVNRVGPDIDGLVDSLVDELLTCAPIAVGLSKRAMDVSARPTLAASLELEIALQEACARTDDFTEGATAFAEKRQPSFSGS